MLRTAGFDQIITTDQTIEYRSTQRRWMGAAERYEDAIREAVGHEVYDERAATRQATLTAIDTGLLSRFRYTAVR